MGNGVVVRLLRRAIAISLALLAVLAPAAGAKTIKPRKLSDHTPNGCTKSDCTLREAVDKANGTPAKDKIVLRSGKIYRLHIPGIDEDMNATGDIDVTAPVKISAKGKRATVNAKGVDRVFHVPAAATASVKLVNLVIKGGDVSESINPTEIGGGVLNDGSGALSVVKSVVTQNRALAPGTSGGGGIGSSGSGELKITKTSVTKNVSNRGGGVYADTTATIVGSTISGNKSTGTGGGVKGAEGLTMRNSTVYGNKADTDGGGISALANATLNNVTVVKNKAGDAGGGIDSSGTTIVSNSLIALNSLKPMALGGKDCAGAFISGGHNLRGSDQMGCTGFTGPGDIVKPSPKLGKLTSNGGPTKTVALKQGSPAIGKAGSNSEPRDQRGRKRDHHPDIGAFER